MPQESTAQVVRNLPTFNDPNLVVGTEDFSDAGVYRLRDDLYIVQSLDFFPPLVDDPYLFGQIAAANSLSDIFAMGADATTAMNIVGFPDDKLDLDILGEILRGGAEKVQEAGAALVGGHTVRDVEIKYGLSVTGVASPETLRTNSNATPGDLLVLTKPLGTGFVTTAYKKGGCPAHSLAAATASMTQLNSFGNEAAKAYRASASTDITGFGLAGHAIEMAQASKVSFSMNTSSLPLIEGAVDLMAKGNKTRASHSNRQFAEPSFRIEGSPDASVVECFFDPQTSGGLLISIAADRAEKLVEHAQQAGATAACIVGSVLEQEKDALIIQG